MTAIKAFSNNRRFCSALLVGTVLGGMTLPAYAQEAPPEAAVPAETAPQPEAPAAPPASTVSPPAVSILAPPAPIGTIRSIAVTGGQRLEDQTILSYTSLRVGEPYTRERLDEALRDLYATELFSDVQIRDDQGALTIQVSENPVVNRIVLEGNERLKNDKIAPEIRLAPREIFTRSKVRADVARIIELYRRQGRFAATVEPKIVELDQNRVDLIFEINEGPRSKVRQINIIGNEAFSDGDLRGEMATEETGLLSFLGSANTFDPDRLAFDQQKLRQFYLTQGYADFRVISAVAELTPDKRDFIITYVVEEGQRYKFGDVDINSDLRDLSADLLRPTLPMETGDWYNAKQVEDTITALNETAGLLGYAFADVRPQFQRNEDDLTMDVTFQLADAPRVYIERIDINGNTVTRDKVIRREFRLAEGDPFNSVRVKRSRDRIQSLGYFQENLEIEQTQGSSPDRVVLSVDVEERPTGSLQISAGFSSLERFLVNLAIEQRNFMGKGQTLQAAVNYSSYSKSVQLGFTEPYLFDRNISLGGDIYRRDFRSFNFTNDDDRNKTYKQLQTGGTIRVGVPLTEYMSLLGRYSLNLDDVTLPDAAFTDPDGNGPQPPVCDPFRVGRYLCDALGERTTSSIGYSLIYDTLNNRLRPSSGERLILNQDFAGLGGSVKYLRTRASAVKYFPIDDSGWVFSTALEGGYIHSLEDPAGPGLDPVRLIDRFFIGQTELRGFDIRGVGPRVVRRRFDADGNIVPGKDGILADDALGGRAYYTARAELQLPFGDDLGLRPSVYVDAGALFGLKDPTLVGVSPDDPRTKTRCVEPDGDSTPAPATGPCPAGSFAVPGILPFQEFYVGDTPKPRVSVGFGVNWISPFGPFRIDIAKALITAEGDDTKLFTFNVGTAF